MDIFTMENYVDMKIVNENLHTSDALHNKFRFQTCMDRNLILVGRTRTGKSTLVNVLNDVFSTTQESRYYTKTIAPIFHKLISLDVGTDTRLFIQVIDTPGFFALAPKDKSGRVIHGNDTTKTFIDLCISHDVTNVHMFALIINIAGEINNEDIETMLFVAKHYHFLSSTAALILTHCEDMDDAQRNNARKRLFMHPKLHGKKLEETFFGIGVFYMGCIKYECEKNNDGRSFKRQYENVSRMRTQLIDALMHSSEPFTIHKSRSDQCAIF